MGLNNKTFLFSASKTAQWVVLGYDTFFCLMARFVDYHRAAILMIIGTPSSIYHI